MNDKEIKVTGTREFDSGAHRDPNTDKGRYDLLSPLFLRRLAIHTQKGGVARGDRNWEAGMPMDAVIDSAIRHLFNYLEGDRSEDHLAAAAWNVMNLIHTEEQIERGNLPAKLAEGLPDYTVRIKTIPPEDVYPELTKKPGQIIFHGPGEDPGHFKTIGPYDGTGKPYENWSEVVSKYDDRGDVIEPSVLPVVGVCKNHGDYPTTIYENCPGCMKPVPAILANPHIINSDSSDCVEDKLEPQCTFEETKRECLNCIHRSPLNGPVTFSTKCIECRRLSNWSPESDSRLEELG
jgi:hypothetical protein